MADSVLVTTHNLPLAGELRDGFRHEGYRVELLTAGESVGDVRDAALLVLTGAADTEAAARQAGEAVAAEIPAFAVLPPGAHDRPPGLSATFATPPDAEEIVLVGTRTIQRRRLRRATGIVGETDEMLEVLERIIQIAPVDATVLVTGESGTGKELVARGLHALSRRRHGPFIPVNVAALSETLLESELFGHEKGAFTGALDLRKGLFELANGGTIFLDEIGEMPLQTQTRLLRVLEQQEFHRVGGQKLIRVNVRIIAATNQQLRDQVPAGAFRKDLYYRLSVLTIALPALRDRHEDIPLLVDTFIREASERHDRGPFPGISPAAMRILERHRWPGNVRELRNLVESMVVLTPGREIGANDIPADIRSGDSRMALVPVGQALTRGEEGAASLGPQLEFIFRTMMQMRVDIEDLRREFERFKEGEGERGGDDRALLPPPSQDSGEALKRVDATEREIGWERRTPPPELPQAAGVREEEEQEVEEEAAPPEMGPDGPVAEGTVAYHPGMTLEDMEREVIRTVLDSVGWNRRKAAEVLGIGERTLYRKVRKFELKQPSG